MKTKVERRRWRPSRWMWVVATLVLVLILFGFFGLPPLLRWQATKRLSAELQRPVAIERIRVNPLVLAMTVEGLDIRDPDGEPFVGWRRFHANFDSFSLFTGEWRFQNIELDGLRGRVRIDPEGRLNFADLLERPAPPPAEDEGEPRPLFVRRLELRDARVTFDDLSRGEPFRTEAGPVNASLQDFRTAGGDDAPYRFEAETEAGEQVRWSGTVAMEPLQSEGQLELLNLSLPKYAPYYQSMIGFDLRNGLLNVSGGYSASLTAEGPQLRWTNGQLAVREVRLAPRDGGDEFVALNEFRLADVNATWAMPGEPTAEVGQIAVQGLRVHAIRTPEGINLLQALQAPDAAAPGAPSAPVDTRSGAEAPPSLPAVSVAALDVTEVDVQWEDRTLGDAAAQLGLQALELHLRNLDLRQPAQRVPFEGRGALASGGTLQWQGEVAVDPLTAAVQVTVSDVAVASGSPYTQSLLNLGLRDGRFGLQGEASLEGQAVRFLGGLSLANLEVVDAESAPLAGWENLEVTGIDAAMQPLQVAIDNVQWTAPWARVQIDEQGQLNLTQLLPKADEPAADAAAAEAPAPPAAEPAANAAPTEPPFELTVNRVQLERAKVEFTDASIEPAAELALTDFSGTITGFSSDPASRAKIDLRGQVGGAPLQIAGDVNVMSGPLSGAVAVDFQNLDLRPVEMYIEKFAGHELEQGTLTIDVAADVQDEVLSSRNVVTLEQFTLGPKVESPDATNLPIHLALALLRDRSGRIVLELPVSGRLDDPAFSIGPVVSRVISNLLTRAATSPFSLLGSMFGGGGEELSYQVFQPGEAEILAEELQKLETVARALRERPALRLEIRGSFDAARDREALQRQRVEEQIAQYLENQRAGTSEESAPEAAAPSPEARDAAIRALAAPRAGEGVAAEAGASPDEPAGSPAAEPADGEDRPSLGQRVVRWVRRVVGRDEPETEPAPETAPTPAPAAGEPAAGTEAAAAEPTPEDLLQRLVAAVEVPPEELQQLARDRAQWVRDYLVGTGGVEAERVTIADPVEQGARVNLGLK